jgi:hypothetical protein
MNNAIYLRRKNKALVEKGGENLPENYIAAFLKNIESLGYTFDEELIEVLKTLSLEDLTVFYKETVGILRELVGAHREFKPMYPNFPEQVLEMSEARLYLNAVIHYLTNRLPRFEKKERIPLLDGVKLKIIRRGTLEDFESIFTKLAASNASLSEQDKLDLKWFVENYRDDVFRLMPQEIPQKETVAFLGSLLIDFTENYKDFLRERIKTATDVLRLAAAMSGGDVSLASNTRFRNFRRFERRLLLELLENAGNITEDMLRWKKRWIRLGERLHAGEFAEKYPKVFEAFDTIRNGKPFETFNAKIERALKEKNAVKVAELLETRAGDFARRLDNLLRLDESRRQEVLEKFAACAAQISTPVLLQVKSHFEHRVEPQTLRIFFPKGNVAKVQAIENKLPFLPKETCAAVAKICKDALSERFSKLPPLGKCFLDERLRNFLVPFSQRSASKTLRTITRGSRLALPESNVIRFFLWWKNGKSRTDIDLSAALYDTDFNYRDVISYYNLKNYGGYHSGDIIDAPEGAAEFIDIDIEKTVSMGIRYVVVSLNSFTEQPYCDLPECFAGWMPRTHAGSGEIFEPKTVADRIDLASDTCICIPMIIDLEKKEVIWTDIALKKTPLWNNVQQNLRGVSLMTRAMTSLKKTTLHELFTLHIEAHGEFADSAENADTIFSVEKGITPFDLETIASEFM